MKGCYQTSTASFSETALRKLIKVFQVTLLIMIFAKKKQKKNKKKLLERDKIESHFLMGEAMRLLIS